MSKRRALLGAFLLIPAWIARIALVLAVGAWVLLEDFADPESILEEWTK